MKHVKQVILIGGAIGFVLGATAYIGLSIADNQLEAQAVANETEAMYTKEPVSIAKAVASGGLRIDSHGSVKLVTEPQNGSNGVIATFTSGTHSEAVTVAGKLQHAQGFRYYQRTSNPQSQF